MKKLLLTILFTSVLFAEDEQALITFKKGSVEITANGNSIPAKINTPIPLDAQVKTSEGAKLEIKFDGSEFTIPANQTVFVKDVIQKINKDGLETKKTDTAGVRGLKDKKKKPTQKE